MAEAFELAGESDHADEQLLGALFEAQHQQQIRPLELLQRHEDNGWISCCWHTRINCHFASACHASVSKPTMASRP